jgi:type I restriction enzyme S subunit
MAGNWIDCSLGAFIHVRPGRMLPNPQRKPGTVPVISSAGHTGNHNAAHALGPGVVTGQSGTLGKVFFVEEDFWPLNTSFYVSGHDFKGNHPRFVAYLLEYMNLSQYAIGTAVPVLNRQHLLKIPVRVPTDIGEQRAIADILGAIDDKIKVNMKMAKSLEQSAEIITSEYIQRSNDTRLGASYEMFDVIYGYSFKADFFNKNFNGMPVIRIRDIETHESITYTSENVEEKYVVRPGDLIAGMDGAFRLHQWKGPVSLLNQRVCKILPQSGVPRALVIHILRPLLLSVEKIKVGTTVIHLGKSDFDRMQVFIPSDETIREIGRLTDSLMDRAIVCHQETRTLFKARNALLPRLLSGNLRVERSADGNR